MQLKDLRSLLERLYAQQGALKAFFERRSRLRPDAAELAQEVYLRILRSAHPEQIRNPEAYLFTVAANLAREHALLQKQRGQTVELDEEMAQVLPAEFQGFEGEADHERRLARLHEVLGQLPEKCQAAVILQYWHGLSYAEIGERLGISPSMVKKYLSQALLHCRRRMQRLG
jgi:RNA polymerase sigma-70 factor (ECF subfamily)